MHCHLYSIRDAPKDEAFRAQLRGLGVDIVRWEASTVEESASAPVPPDFLVGAARGMVMFVRCSTPHTQAAQVDMRAREDRIVIRAGLIARGDRVYRIGQDRIQMKGLDVALVYQEKGRIIHGSGASPERSISLAFKPSILRRRLGERLSQLPPQVRDVILGKRPFYREGRVSGQLMSLMSSLDDLFSIPRTFLDMHAEAIATAYLASALDTFAASNPRPRGPTASEAARLENVRSLIEEDPARHYDVEELGRRAAMNRTKLRAAFKFVYGMTLFDYQTGSRMRLAQRRLRSTELSLEALAHELGYANAASFVVAYKAFFGSTPGRARKR